MATVTYEEHDELRRRQRRGTVVRAVKDLLREYDRDPHREGLKDTPGRVAALYEDLLTERPYTFTTFDAEGATDLVVVRAIPFFALCEHHLLPFFGQALVAYLPGERLAGLSKLARVVEACAHHLQTQERLTEMVADSLMERLDPRGVGVAMVARHLCLEMRGVCRPGVLTQTTARRGALACEGEATTQFWALVQAQAAVASV